jgi:hypothetical protein
MKRPFRSTGIPLIAIYALMCNHAEAQNGAFEINQTCAETGCFPGDDPGFPVLLTEPGTYILTSNLEVVDPGDSAIVISTSNIAIDLNRFSVSGPVVCSGVPAKCDQQGPANGIDGGFHENLRITNGTVSGFSQWGIVTGPNSYVVNIVSRSNSGKGIVARDGTQVSNSKAIGNEGTGIELRGSSIAKGVVVRENGTGIGVGCAIDNGCNQVIESNISASPALLVGWQGRV